MSTARHKFFELQNDETWRKSAACRNSNPNLFFPEGRPSEVLKQSENAKLICRTCDSQAECLEYALSTYQNDGVWGGTSEKERREIQKERARREARILGATALT